MTNDMQNIVQALRDLAVRVRRIESSPFFSHPDELDIYLTKAEFYTYQQNINAFDGNAYDHLGAGITVSGTWTSVAVIPYDMTLISCEIASVVAAPNDASNYWTIQLVPPGYTQWASANTSANTPGSWTKNAFTISRDDMHAATEKILGVYVTKTGSPGSISVTNPYIIATWTYIPFRYT
jgi:hypothetical protein